jgi:hypothetical protein
MRFTIRDLLWLTVVVALGAAWWMSEQRHKKEVLRLEEQILLGPWTIHGKSSGQ